MELLPPNILFARSKDFRLEKPLLPIINIGWNTVLVVSSKSKENNQVIYQNGKPRRSHKNSLLDKKHLYIETEMKIQSTNEIWYTVMGFPDWRLVNFALILTRRISHLIYK